ncbi:MAG: SRPBCC family protein [Capsulimonadales bacterium]|nr:SRPBCC family protein [Capsulimonadales bacterium]
MAYADTSGTMNAGSTDSDTTLRISRFEHNDGPEPTHSGANRNQGMMGSINIGMPERIISGVAGTALTAYAMKRLKTPDGAVLAATGLYLVARGVSGHCFGYAALRTGTNGATDSPNAAIPHGQGIKVEKTVTINRPAATLYDFWRRFENLPRFMKHLESVREITDTRSHWVAKAPLNNTVEWDAEVIQDIPNERIAWKSLEGAQVPNAGSVRFRELPNGRGTELKVNLEYNPPAGALGAAIAKLFGEEPSVQVEDDLNRFRSLMETGEIPTVSGQPKGR